MNRTAVITTAALTLAFSACQKSTPPEETLAEATPAPVKPAAATPAQANVPAAAAPIATATAPAAPAAPELAPAGVFFLTAPVSFETADGISRLIPGQRLQLARPGTYTADGREVALRDDQVTNDLAFARVVAEEDARAQNAIRKSLASRPAVAAAGAPAPAQAQAQAAPQPAAAPKPAARTALGSSLDGSAHSQQQDRKRWHKTISGTWIYN